MIKLCFFNNFTKSLKHNLLILASLFAHHFCFCNDSAALVCWTCNRQTEWKKDTQCGQEESWNVWFNYVTEKKIELKAPSQCHNIWNIAGSLLGRQRRTKYWVLESQYSSYVVCSNLEPVDHRVHYIQLLCYFVKVHYLIKVSILGVVALWGDGLAFFQIRNFW